jgi:hypothetical protein
MVYGLWSSIFGDKWSEVGFQQKTEHNIGSVHPETPKTLPAFVGGAACRARKSKVLCVVG